MSLNERERRELSDLASRAADGTITAADHARLEQVLRDSPDARTYYVRFMDVSAGLAWAARDEAEFAPVAGNLTRDHQRGWLTATAAAAALAFAIFGIWTMNRRPIASSASTPAGIATLSTNMNIEWVDAREPDHVGNMLQPGWVRMKSGLAQIDFLNGASVWLEGPVEFRLDSPREAFCASGKVVAQVPRGASDFHLGSPHLSLDEKGTGFGVEVTKGNRDCLHVFRGTVEVTLHTTQAKTHVGPGQAIAVDQAGATSMMNADPNTFSREEFGVGGGRWGGWGGGSGGGGNSEYSRPMGAPWMYASMGMGPSGDWGHAQMGPPPVIFPGQWKGADPMDPLRDLLGSSDERWAAIKKPLDEFLAEQWKNWGLDNNPDDKGVARAKWNLQFAVEDRDSSDEELAKRLQALREARAESSKRLKEKELALKEKLTADEQAKLVMQGYIP